ncbi:hypothetical protein NEHOM01_1185 [Nematocida homosporus]|uniref:uncharacterized protein n=1 Tax=Nematocida homosporus TaxID=1912981 RepID=UPI00222063E4|nr:uncharacterized protein NEHOM01_1185 [Nematocida homosporus]KAI5185962.1 hypothetical protein NEHOM01_1185 [Nematocida homosporus]
MGRYSLVRSYNGITITKEISVILAVIYLDLFVYMVSLSLLYALQMRVRFYPTADIETHYYSLSAFLNNGFVVKLVYGVLMTEGLLKRNLMQVVVCTLTQFVIMGIRLWMILVLDAGTNLRYLVLGFNIAGIVADMLIMLYIIVKQRKEFVWFFHKPFGTNTQCNTMFSIRRLLDLSLKAGFQLFMSMLIISFLIMKVGVTLIVETVLYVAILLISQIDCYEIVSVRMANISLNFGMTVFLLIEIILFRYAVRPIAGNLTYSEIYPYLVVTLSLRVLLRAFYVGILTLDLLSFNKGILCTLALKQKKRKFISSVDIMLNTESTPPYIQVTAQ